MPFISITSNWANHASVGNYFALFNKLPCHICGNVLYHRHKLLLLPLTLDLATKNWSHPQLIHSSACSSCLEDLLLPGKICGVWAAENQHHFSGNTLRLQGRRPWGERKHTIFIPKGRIERQWSNFGRSLDLEREKIYDWLAPQFDDGRRGGEQHIHHSHTHTHQGKTLNLEAFRNKYIAHKSRLKQSSGCARREEARKSE